MGEDAQEVSETETKTETVYIFNYCEECELVSRFCFKSNSAFQHISVQPVPLQPQYVNEGNTILCFICSLQCFHNSHQSPVGAVQIFIGFFQFPRKLSEWPSRHSGHDWSLSRRFQTYWSSQVKLFAFFKSKIKRFKAEVPYLKTYCIRYFFPCYQL